MRAKGMSSDDGCILIVEGKRKSRLRRKKVKWADRESPALTVVGMGGAW
jgi:hypothetical protein